MALLHRAVALLTLSVILSLGASPVPGQQSISFGLHGVALSRPFAEVVHELHQWHGESPLLAEQFDEPYKFTVRELNEAHGVVEVRTLAQLGDDDGAVYFLSLYFHLGPDGDTHYLKSIQLSSHNFSAPSQSICRERGSRILDRVVGRAADSISQDFSLVEHALSHEQRKDGSSVNRERYLYTAPAGDYPQPFRAPKETTLDYDELQIKSSLRLSGEPGSAPGGGRLCRHEVFLRMR